MTTNQEREVQLIESLARLAKTMAAYTTENNIALDRIVTVLESLMETNRELTKAVNLMLPLTGSITSLVAAQQVLSDSIRPFISVVPEARYKQDQ